MARKTVTLENMNQNVKHMGHEVNSPLLTRAAEIQKELAMGINKPFQEIIRADLEDNHSIGKKPLTFLRQVLTVCEYPPWMSKSEFPPDVKQRAHTILEDCGGYSIGSYTYGVGIEVIRKHVAQFIERRDGIQTDYQNVILFSGASEAIRAVINVLNYPKNGKPPGLLIPIPKYPLYTSILMEYGMHEIGYFLDEEKNWEVNINEMRTLINEAKQHCHPRALVVINPGNPTGSVLTRKNMEEIIEFAHDEQLFLMADEVYQETVYSNEAEFLSFKRVAKEMNSPYCNMEIASFMSASKGYMGECGLRGGYCEIINILPPVMEVLLKSVATRLCPSVMGQAAIDCVVNAPEPGEPSYELFIKEKNEALNSLKKNAELILNSFNGTSGITCSKISAATYAFPRIFLPQEAIKAALLNGVLPDYYYTMQLLENTGICVIPGCILGQRPGTFHIRIPLSLPMEKLKKMINSILEFHKKFLEETN